jgi:nitrilase
MASICACAKENSIVVVLGFSENSHNSLYIAQNVISATGEILMHRRKLKPTHMERTVFGDASGGSLDNVVEAGSIGRVGSLSCWEHTQPLLKYHTMSQREDIHVAAWPPLFPHSGNSMLKEDLFSLSKDGRSTAAVARCLANGYLQVARFSHRRMPLSPDASCCMLPQCSRLRAWPCSRILREQ